MAPCPLLDPLLSTIPTFFRQKASAKQKVRWLRFISKGTVVCGSEKECVPHRVLAQYQVELHSTGVVNLLGHPSPSRTDNNLSEEAPDPHKIRTKFSLNVYVPETL